MPSLLAVGIVIFIGRQNDDDDFASASLTQCALKLISGASITRVKHWRMKNNIRKGLKLPNAKKQLRQRYCQIQSGS
jgi:hypothetical protein